MIPLLQSLPRHVPLFKSQLRDGSFQSKALLFRSLSSSHLPFPTTPTCPDPTCACAPTPSMPDGLPIDYSRPLNATMSPYLQQVLISTGQEDWTSRIEDDGVGESWGTLVRELKTMFGRGGKYADPYNNLVMSNSSFQPSSHASSSFASAFLFPAFKYFPKIPTTTSSSIDSTNKSNLESFARAFLLPHKLHPAHAGIPESQRQTMTRSPEPVSHFPDALDIKKSPTILICGHGGRDMRCGIMRPVLQAEFERVLRRKGFTINSADGENTVVDGTAHANIGSISHIGGHKYAGNVIMYIPPALMTTSASSPSSPASTAVSGPSPLAGKGIWYGRVEPKHVEGLVEETIFNGTVVEEHFRGGIGMDGEIYRL